MEPAYAENLRIPQSVTEIEEEAFFNNQSINNIIFPSGIRIIGDRAFARSSVKTVTFPDSIEFIGEHAFEGSALESVIATEGTIGYEWAVSHGYIGDAEEIGLSFKLLPDGTVAVSGYTGNASEINIPAWYKGKRVIKIVDNAFAGNDSLRKVAISDNVTRIENSAFKNCANLNSIDLPETLTYIGENAFSGCSSLTQLNLPDGITGNGRYAFPSTTNLVCNRNSTTARTISSGWFGSSYGYGYCFKSPGEDDYLYVWGTEKLYLVRYTGNAEELVLPEWVDLLYDGCFTGRENLKKIILTEKISEIPENCFKNCTNLSSINLPVTLTYMTPV